MMKREHWGSRLGFILAAAGSAVGLGNIWKFPYIAGVNGGGAFVLVYLICVFVIGLPIMMSEILMVIHIEVTDQAEDAATLLRNIDGIRTVDVVTKNDRTRIDVVIDPDSKLDTSELPNRLITKGYRITSIQSEQVNLETAFMRLTKGLVS